MGFENKDYDTVEAKTKEEAAQLLNISKRQVVCISDYHPNKK